MKLFEYLTNQILEEERITKIIATYPGRFQPFGKHHAEVFKWIEKKFGKNNSYIATSNKVELPSSPFNFNEKRKIINKYGFKNVVQVKNPYISSEIINKFDPLTTSVVFILGEKDYDRLKGSKFFLPWKDNPKYGYEEHAYLLIAPHESLKISGYGEMNGTTIRKSLGDQTISDKEKIKLFKQIFGYYDKNVYDMIVNKLKDLNEIISEFVIRNKLNEISINSSAYGSDVDDGPRAFYGGERAYELNNDVLALKMGFEIINYLTGKEMFHVYDNYKTDYPQGPVPSVTYFPAGDVGSVNVGTQYVQLRGNPAYQAWLKHIKKVALRLGYTFVFDIEDKDSSIRQSSLEPKKKEDDILTNKEYEKSQKKIEKNSPVNENKIFSKDWWLDILEEN